MLFFMFSTLGGLSDNSPATFQQFFKRSRLTLSKAFFYIFYLINLMIGFHLKQIGGCIHSMHTHTPPWTIPLQQPPHTHPRSGNFSPRSLSFWHFDLLMTSFFPGLFSSSTRASPTSLTVRNNKGLFI